MAFSTGLDAVHAAIRATAKRPAGHKAPAALGVRSVVTISRQAGAPAGEVAARLETVLNERRPGTPRWIAYDRALVERVAEDHKVSKDLVASLDEQDKTWFEHFTAGLSGHATGTDIALKTAQTIRGLARVGRVIVVGRGAQCVLAEVPDAVHVRLAAPLEWRAARYAGVHGLSERDAERAVRELDQSRTNFIRSHFHRDVADPDLYGLIINMARTSVTAAADAIAALVDRS